MEVRTQAARDRKYEGKIEFLPDPGSNFTAITPQLLAAMGIDKQRLRGRGTLPIPKQADGAAGKLRPLGFFRGRFLFGGLTHEEDIYVMRVLDKPLLSKRACLALGIYESKVLAGGQVAEEKRRGARRTQMTDETEARNIPRAGDNSGHLLAVENGRERAQLAQAPE